MLEKFFGWTLQADTLAARLVRPLTYIYRTYLVFVWILFSGFTLWARNLDHLRGYLVIVGVILFVSTIFALVQVRWEFHAVKQRFHAFEDSLSQKDILGSLEYRQLIESVRTLGRSLLIYKNE